jgi:adenylosuccinate synthase
VTSSSCVTGACFLTGLPCGPQCLQSVWGIAKLYDTYVGAKPFGDPDNPDLIKLQILGEEFGSTTQRPRKCDWLHLGRLKKAIYVNGVTHVVFNKCDILKKLGVFKLYDDSNRSVVFSHYQDMETYVKQFVEQLKLDIQCYFSGSKTSL